MHETIQRKIHKDNQQLSIIHYTREELTKQNTNVYTYYIILYYIISTSPN